jgi:hypothetical protein
MRTPAHERTGQLIEGTRLIAFRAFWIQQFRAHSSITQRKKKEEEEEEEEEEEGSMILTFPLFFCQVT